LCTIGKLYSGSTKANYHCIALSNGKKYSWISVLSYPIFMLKPSTHRMYAQDQLFHIYRQKVFTDNQMSWIKYIYYIDNVPKHEDDSHAKWNSGRIQNTIKTATGTSHSLELLVKEFQSFITFWVAGLNNREKRAGENNKVVQQHKNHINQSYDLKVMKILS
jgi:hypothetical protein